MLGIACKAGKIEQFSIGQPQGSYFKRNSRDYKEFVFNDWGGTMTKKTAILISILVIAALTIPVGAYAAERYGAAPAGWNKQVSGVTSNLTAISAVSKDIAWAVGSAGVILKTVDGSAWGAPQWPGHPTVTLNSVTAVNLNTAWAVGNASVAVQTVDGATWNTTPGDPLPYTENLHDVWSSGPLLAWVVGDNGTIVKTEDGGTNWTKQDSKTTEHLWSISALNNNIAWAVGNDGTILKTVNGGADWVKQTSGTSQMLRGVQLLDADTVRVVGYSGTTLLTADGGATWRKQACPVDDILTSVGLSDSSTGWAVGYNDQTDVGFAVKTVDAGRNWFIQPMAAAELLSIAMVNSDIAWAVGDEGHIWKTEGGENTNYTWYFAEGYTGTGFQEYLCLGNAGDTDATADVNYIFQGGDSTDKTYTVPANSRTTIDVNAEIGSDKSNSVKVTSFSPDLVAERPMYFDYTGDGTRNWQGGTDAIGARSPSYTWFFAEGNTLSEFDQYITIFNPMSTTRELTFRYQVEGEGEKVFTEDVGGSSRTTYKARDHVGNGKNISLLLESEGPVVAERPMYFNYMGLGAHGWTGGHCVLGTPYPGKEWYFAEGTTRNNTIDGAFEEWLTIQNPTGNAATVNAVYQLGAGQGDPVNKTYQIPANERLTVSVNGETGNDKDVSVKLTSSTDFIVERPMYFNYHGKYPGGHDVMGTSKASVNGFLAEGYTGQGFEQWMCVQNSGNTDAALTVTYYSQNGGDPITKTHTVKANTRYTVDVNKDAGSNLMISTKIESSVPVIVERPMYFTYGTGWQGGTDVVGFSPGD